MNRFEQTRKEIEQAYYPVRESRPIFYEYNSDYRRIVVLGSSDYPIGRGFEIRTEYKGFAKMFIKTWSSHWGKKLEAIGWAKAYAKNRNIICGSLTIIEKIGKQII